VAARHSREPRVVARCQVEFERLDRRVTAESEDLSRRGIFVRTDELLPVGAVTEVDITLPDGVGFKVFARVAHMLSPSAARALGRHVGMGFEFLDTDGGGLEALSSYLDNLIEELTPPPRMLPSTSLVYVAEPSRPLRERIAVALETAGFTVEAFHDGAEAYRAAAAQAPNILIAATDMPLMDGLTLVRTLSVHPRLSKVPVVLTSGDPSDLTRLEAFRLGVRDYISKPFHEEELVIRVHRVAVSAPRGSAESAMLRGNLAEISIGTLLSLLEFERKSGILVVLTDSEAARLFVAEGRVVKVESPRDGDARERLMVVLDWTHGEFEFSGCEVVGADELGQATTMLLLEHARVSDERNRR
jgi:DNA-binding response OmpR family regulator